jgi:uncharacterized protein
MPRREGLPNAVMAIWGGIELQQLTSDEISTVASGRSVAGLSVSFLGDVQRSAKAGVPIYRLAGHAGFLWVATYNSSGRGVLRYLAMDRSKIGSKIENPDQLANPASPARLHAPTPSFDCAKASMADELVICSNSELAELNKAIATGYEFVRSANGDLIVKQIDAPLSQARQACGSDFTCIKDQQIAAVNTYQNRGAPVKVSMWNLDGSEMILIVNGQSRKFFYDIPRPELISAGARSGSIAFDGRAISQQYVGTAYLFDSMCGQNGYQVSGPILDNYERVVLQGPAPQLTQNCIPQGYSTATLDFKLNTGSSIANPLGPNLNVTPNRSAASISPPTPNVTPSTPTPSPPAPIPNQSTPSISPATPNVTPSTPTPSPSVSPSPPAPKPPVSSAPRQYQSTTSPATAFEISPLAILFLVYVFVAGVVTWRSVRRWNLWNGIFIGAWGSSFIENLIRLILYRIGFELFIFGMACIFGALGGWIFVVLKVVNEKKQAQPA